MAGKPTFRKSADRYVTEYAVHKAVPHTKKHAYGSVSIHNNGYFPNFETTESGRVVPTSYTDLHVEKQPETLFTHAPAVVESAFSDPTMQIHIPTLLAMAHKAHGILQVSEDLSRHSARLAKHGVRIGAAIASPFNTDMEDTNGIEFSERRAPVSDMNAMYPTKISDNDVSIAKGHLRTMLGRDKPRKQHMGPQFYQAEAEQPQLPGMEGM